TVASAAVPTAAAIPAATAAAVLPGLGLVDGQGPAVDLLAAQPGDGRLRLLVGAHLHEAEPLRAPGVAVGDHLSRLHRTELPEQPLQVTGGRLVGQIADVQFLAHLGLLKKAGERRRDTRRAGAFPPRIAEQR